MPITSPGNDDDTGENHQPTLRKNTAEPVEQTLKQNRGGQEVVEDEQFHAFELVDLTVALALAFEPGAVDLFEHVLRSDVAVRDAVAEGGVAERLADVALVGPVPDMMIRVSLSLTHRQAVSRSTGRG
mgnify:CR=1 FL=1